MSKNLKDIDFALLKLLNDLKEALLATWRNGYAEDCKSFYPSSILGVASNKLVVLLFQKKYVIFHSSVAQLVEQLTVNQLVAGSSPARGATNQISLMKQYFLEFEEFSLFVI